MMRFPTLTSLAILLSVNLAMAADFRVPKPEALPNASEGVKAALTMLTNKESEGAVKKLKELATAGDPEAQFVLGLCTQYGEGVTPSLQAAQEWYLKAADSGQAAAAVRPGGFPVGKRRTGEQPEGERGDPMA